MEKYEKSHIRMKNLKDHLQHGIRILNDLIDHIVYQIFNIILNILKRHGEKTVNSSIRICTNKIENRITFKIKTVYHLEITWEH